MMSVLIYALAAMLEIAGCFAVWSWWRGTAGVVWLVPGAFALAGFALLLAMTPPAVAGRSFAAYGGIYVAASLGWMWAVERAVPDRVDLLGVLIVLAGAAVILWVPRG